MAALAEYKQVIAELEEMYKAKNHDYGDSFAILLQKFGLESAVIRLWDKILRLETLCEKEAKVLDESTEDTLKDIANYSIMTVAEMRKMQGEREAQSRRLSELGGEENAAGISQVV